MSCSYIRELAVYADGQRTAGGCRLHLTGGRDLGLRPGLFLLKVYDASPNAVGKLSSAKALEVKSGHSILAWGEVCDARTYPQSGSKRTEIAFSPGMKLWKSVCALTVTPGLKISDTVKAILRASGTETPLSGYTAEDPIMPRAQTFFGRTAEALTLLAETAKARPCLTPGGLQFMGRKAKEGILVLTEGDILNDPERTTEGVILRTKLKGWPEGACVRYRYKDTEGLGQLLETSVDADTKEGPWQSEILVSCP